MGPLQLQLPDALILRFSCYLQATEELSRRWGQAVKPAFVIMVGAAACDMLMGDSEAYRTALLSATPLVETLSTPENWTFFGVTGSWGWAINYLLDVRRELRSAQQAQRELQGLQQAAAAADAAAADAAAEPPQQQQQQ